ncbi:MAG: NlpC/P60 family protein [Smithellaceae bacterium]|nr:NlpC/P60 family protein [Smithellaceae bacterium]
MTDRPNAGNYKTLSLLIVLLVVLIPGCARERRTIYLPPPIAPPDRQIPLVGFTIQAGAFSRVENAARLTTVLQERGLDATYFKADDGLYKVRFGNFTTRNQAEISALALRADGVISDFYLVTPEEQPASRTEDRGINYLRAEIVKSARNYIGIPYLWGGNAADSGFDCSGLTMAVYRLNGVRLPRSSQEQYERGAPIDQGKLTQGDLVFFATEKVRSVSHVGIYMGEGQFIHAPGQGKHIRFDSLDHKYYKSRYLGGRSYL